MWIFPKSQVWVWAGVGAVRFAEERCSFHTKWCAGGAGRGGLRSCPVTMLPGKSSDSFELTFSVLYLGFLIIATELQIELSNR